MSEYLLTIESLACTREGRTLFRALSFTVAPGECVELTGPNGSGKSTLLRCIAGLFPDFEGGIRAAGPEYLGHRPGVSLALSPLENLRWYASLDAGGQSPAILESILERVGLAGYDDVPCQQLSAGQQRRVALARLMLGRGRLWLLDEPFTALDTEGQALVRTLIEDHLAADGAAVCATHQPLDLSRSVGVRLGQPG